MCDEMTESDFYAKGKSYWETIPATIDGMLGGHSSVLNADIRASSRFLEDFLEDKKQPVGKERALDCGSGIGRVTKHLLAKFFTTVDMVEQNKEFLDASHVYLDQENKRVCLQDFIPDEKHYDVIWCQWVTGHLTDDDFVSFLKRCKNGLKDNGIIVIKDNLSSGEIDTDHEDGSVTRPRELLVSLFKRANLTLLAERKQYKFPKGLYQVKMFALR
ncbi:N-terminal Xaa-Pro-Lys N-methyltransferase 1-B-like isoform X2 [Stegodyphus dumicola]|uniref:N-terminal Xaa-Pro-Lys N-methyltransferase 1-B-like isoform X2 n=1 Tax=Stegodyphus dumicola TaxID=202533 RepID=UPI0015B26AE1|nr:N-terminal Xaa-Pro-Lys N-methyltransferase 1-B-like isoform X2 [Stegodyphus dumicola]